MRELLATMMTDDEFSNLPRPVALVVDDEPLILMDTADIVADQGFHVLEAKTADEAFSFLKEHPTLKLLFTDIQMPGKMDGIELAQYVGAHWPQIQVIVASGAIQPAEGVLPETARFIGKSISAELVREVLNEMSEGRAV